MPTNYVPNGTTLVNGLTWDDRLTWVMNALPTGRLVLVLNGQTASPTEAISGDASGALTFTDTTTNTALRVPIYTTGTLPSATTAGRIIYTSDDGVLRVSSAGTWVILATSGGAGVTASGNLDANQVVIGAGGAVVQKLGALGTTTTVLHGNAAGAPTFGAVALTTDVTGTLPIGSGGTGQVTANLALNALLPSQGGNASKFLATDGSNTSWSAPTTPTGSVTQFAGSSAPSGWVLCDGASYLRSGAGMDALFAVIGTTYGAADGTHFNVPDMRGRVAVGTGAGSGLTNRTLAATGGEETHVLVTAELANHTHGPGSLTVPLAAGDGGPGTAANYSNTNTVSGTLAVSAGVTGAAGSGTGHNTMPPFLVLTYIIKT